MNNSKINTAYNDSENADINDASSKIIASNNIVIFFCVLKTEEF